MYHLICPYCDEILPDHALDEKHDVMKCPSCGQSCVLSHLRAGKVPPRIVLDQPPPGAWYVPINDGCRAGYSTRSLAVVLLIPFTALWVLFSFNMTFGPQITAGTFSTILSLFGLLCVAVSIWMLIWIVMLSCGRVEVMLTPIESEVFIGARSIGLRWQFDASSVRAVRETYKMRRPFTTRARWAKYKAGLLGDPGITRRIEIKMNSGDVNIRLGNPERMRFLHGVLCRYLVRK